MGSQIVSLEVLELGVGQYALGAGTRGLGSGSGMSSRILPLKVIAGSVLTPAQLVALFVITIPLRPRPKPAPPPLWLLSESFAELRFIHRRLRS